jgi:hypothetical protein
MVGYRVNVGQRVCGHNVGDNDIDGELVGGSTEGCRVSDGVYVLGFAEGSLVVDGCFVLGGFVGSWLGISVGAVGMPEGTIVAEGQMVGTTVGSVGCDEGVSDGMDGCNDGTAEGVDGSADGRRVLEGFTVGILDGKMSNTGIAGTNSVGVEDTGSTCTISGRPDWRRLRNFVGLDVGIADGDRVGGSNVGLRVTGCLLGERDGQDEGNSVGLLVAGLTDGSYEGSDVEGDDEGL